MDHFAFYSIALAVAAFCTPIGWGLVRFPRRDHKERDQTRGVFALVLSLVAIGAAVTAVILGHPWSFVVTVTR